MARSRKKTAAVPVEAVDSTASALVADGTSDAPDPLDGGDETLDEEDTSWFDSPEWQAGEARVDEQFRAGRVRSYRSVRDLLADLQPGKSG